MTAEQCAENIIQRYGPMPLSEDMYRAALEFAFKCGCLEGAETLADQIAKNEQALAIAQTEAPT
jgi:hypothetical protein